MEIRDFAQQILFGTRLQDKLIQPDVLVDLLPGKPVETPNTPGRPPALHLDAWHGRPKVNFPSAAGFHVDHTRGTVLHFFANHELLAMELMALVLLRFPDAPSAFRSGVARTILEEQRHMQKYMNRMQVLGVVFGEIPVNDFFWSCISKMKTPLDFVVQMSLTFEQANLDFALHYKNLFREFGDLETADLLDEVYEDEIGHVKHGVAWFHKFKDPGEEEWEGYVKRLPFPLNPSRAKGLGFSVEARRRAGLSEHFIRELAVFTQSKGRPPAVHVFNPIAESEVATGACSFSPSKNVQMLCDDLETLPMFVAAHEDVVLVRRKPSTEYLEVLRSAGFSIPEFVVYAGYQKPFPAALRKRKIASCAPWGWSPVTESFFRPVLSECTQLELCPPALFEKREQQQDQSKQITFVKSGLSNLYSKAQSAQWLQQLLNSGEFSGDTRLCSPDVVGKRCVNLEQVQAHTAHLWQMGFDVVVVKGLFGSSGQNNVKLMRERTNEAELRWIEKTCASAAAGEIAGSVVVEPWLANCLDLSVQIKVEADQVLVCGVARFLTDGRGQYRGTLLGRRTDGLSSQLIQFLYRPPLAASQAAPLASPANHVEDFPEENSGSDKDIFLLLERVGRFVGTQLREQGFCGPAGIDALVYRDHRTQSFCLKPIVEVNPRLTMGRVALEIGRRLVPGVTGLWCHVAVSRLRTVGFESAGSFAQHLQEQVGLECTQTASPLIKRGVVFTQDPSLATGMLTFLLVEKNGAQCQAWLEKNKLETQSFLRSQLGL